MLVHRTSIAEDTEPVALQLLRDQLNRTVYPIHRIDRPTSGILLFAHDPNTTRTLQNELKSDDSQKKYTALVRGWLVDEVLCNREVKNDRGNLQTAETRFKKLHNLELPIPTDRYETARFSLIEAFPTTGRWHQIRQHLAQLRHYIINDRVHGDGKQNRIFTEKIGIREMFLHATSLQIKHPVSKELLIIEAPFSKHWEHFVKPTNEWSRKLDGITQIKSDI